ncbi:hypothetical protein [Schlesneria sp.]|uniref:hypothetical protein n=1 Tax=Schlesneria sp. TaxID=2762018 RepID=UPI002EEEB3CD
MTTSNWELNELLWSKLEGIQANPLPLIFIAMAVIFFWVARVRVIERTRRRVTAAAEAYAARELSLE